ncbi:hypothetical protein [Acinetobacter proteolyticus]|uniref:Uncharacterized protein n=1 Tax=Acinetobacter proteolyticus TaxID=1776741 RepID=A0A2N0WBP1_9GAMM|nr:hypothetical protein [Acinetobacter proteolyticus]PKF31924.1 hypothetical protein CW311_16955 [Acinetobacter proteolyticus]
MKFKKFGLFFLLISSSFIVHAGAIDSKAGQASKLLIDDLKSKVILSNGSYSLNNKPILFDFNVWDIRLKNTFDRCDEEARYFNSESYQKDCYTKFIRSYYDWIEASKDPKISLRVWRAAASDGLIGPRVDFEHWTSMIRVYQARFDKLDKENADREKLYAEIGPYDSELRQVVQQRTREMNKPSLFGSKKKQDELYQRQIELEDKIRQIRANHQSN